MLTPNKAIAWLIVICHTPAKKNKKHNPSTLFIALPPSPSIGLRGRSRRGLLQEENGQIQTLLTVLANYPENPGWLRGAWNLKNPRIKWARDREGKEEEAEWMSGEVRGTNSVYTQEACVHLFPPINWYLWRTFRQRMHVFLEIPAGEMMTYKSERPYSVVCVGCSSNLLCLFPQWSWFLDY